MRVSVVTEIKPQEARVGLTPAGAADLRSHGHAVNVQAGAGRASGFTDDEYRAAGAGIVDQADAWADADLLVKVKEPVESEYGFLRGDLTLFTYLHLAADRPLTEALLHAGTCAIAYETVQDATGLPLLTPMSEIAGRLAAHAAAAGMTRPGGGPGVLLGGVPGVAPCRVVVIGGGVVGTQAALLALGMQAEVTILDTSARRIRQLNDLFGSRARIVMSDAATLENELAGADVVIGAVLVPGRSTPKVLKRTHLRLLKPSTLLIDVAIDQGGAFETSHPTTYADPVFTVDGIRHYCVANMPGGVPHTATRALTNATLPYVRLLADHGVAAALDADPSLRAGLNVQGGRITHPGVADAHPDLPATVREAALADA